MSSDPKLNEVPMTACCVSPKTSGCYPVAQKPSSDLVESTAPDYPTSVELASIEVRVLCQAPESCLTYEIWTARSVYEFDRQLRCIAVRDAQTSAAKDHHKCVGTRLIGGRRIGNQIIDVSSPIPALGHSALLGNDEHSTIVTSPVTRVVMYMWRWSSPPKQAAGE